MFTQCEQEHNPVNIPDNAFLNALIELGFDTNRDGLISYAEAEVVISLDIYGENISDLTGIEVFVNLEALFCGMNQLSSLNVSNNTALTQLTCRENQLTSLDCSNNTSLKLLVIDAMPTLFEVCVWTTPFPPDGVQVNNTDSPNVYFTTECSK